MLVFLFNKTLIKMFTLLTSTKESQFKRSLWGLHTEYRCCYLPFICFFQPVLSLVSLETAIKLDVSKNNFRKVEPTSATYSTNELMHIIQQMSVDWARNTLFNSCIKFHNLTKNSVFNRQNQCKNLQIVACVCIIF